MLNRPEFLICCCLRKIPQSVFVSWPRCRGAGQRAPWLCWPPGPGHGPQARTAGAAWGPAAGTSSEPPPAVGRPGARRQGWAARARARPGGGSRPKQGLHLPWRAGSARLGRWPACGSRSGLGARHSHGCGSEKGLGPGCGRSAGLPLCRTGEGGRPSAAPCRGRAWGQEGCLHGCRTCTALSHAWSKKLCLRHRPELGQKKSCSVSSF